MRTRTVWALRQLRGDLWPQRAPGRLAAYAAMFWLASAGFHLMVFAFSGTAWSGAVSWRKPVAFALSVGLLLWTYGLVLDRLPNRPRLAWPLAAGFAAASSGEVGIIALQQWRGRASHFNVFTGGDSLLFALMGGLVAIMSLLLVVLFVWSLIERPADAVERIAVIGGLALVLSGLGIGQWIISLGNSYVDQFDRVPETVISGDAGVAKFPHAVAFHGIQLFMVAAALLRRSAVSAMTGKRTIGVIVSAYVGVLGFSALQSFGGRAPFDLEVASGALLIVSVVVLVGALAMVALWWLASVDDEDAHRPLQSSQARFGS